jgi:hypothetical protein
MTTWRPLPPVVLRKLVRPSLRRRARTSAAAAVTVGQGSDSSGSRSKMRRSGCSSVIVARAPGMDFEDAELRERGEGFRRGGFFGERDVGLDDAGLLVADRTEPMPGGSVELTCFWKKQGFPEPSGQRTMESGRPAMCGSMRGATAK